jgi:hypothetical protein
LPKPVRRFLLYSEFLLNCLRLVGQWNPKVIHGCDLDGYTLARIANGTGRKKIFEVYDPWTTMTQSKRAARAEKKAFQKSDVLVMSAKDSRIKVQRSQATYLGNEVDIDLAESRIRSAQDIRKLFPHYFLKPYILVGGTLSQSIGICELIDAIATFPNINLLIASNRDIVENIYVKPIADNIFFVGTQDWGTWLSFVKSASFIWVYYDVKNFHYESHISPNKYWEASLFSRPMFVYRQEQFCDRVDFEGELIELGSNIDKTLPVFLKEFLDSNEGSESVPSDLHRTDWLEVQQKRRGNVKEIMKWVDLL